MLNLYPDVVRETVVLVGREVGGMAWDFIGWVKDQLQEFATRGPSTPPEPVPMPEPAAAPAPVPDVPSHRVAQDDSMGTPAEVPAAPSGLSEIQPADFLPGGRLKPILEYKG